MERSQKLCISSYFEIRTNLEILEIIHNDINRDLLNKFNYSIITENDTVIIEKKTVYEIVTTRNKNPYSNTTSINLGGCETRLKEYYDIEQNDYLYILVIDAYIEGKTGLLALYEFNYSILYLTLQLCFDLIYLYMRDLKLVCYIIGGLKTLIYMIKIILYIMICVIHIHQKTG